MVEMQMCVNEWCGVIMTNHLSRKGAGLTIQARLASPAICRAATCHTQIHTHTHTHTHTCHKTKACMLPAAPSQTA